MTRQPIETQGRQYLFSPLEEPPVHQRTRRVVLARLLDELTSEPPRSRVTITTTTPGLVPRVADAGFGGLVGIPGRVFPGLRMQDYSVDIEIVAEGYVTRREVVTLPRNPSFPEDFSPEELTVSLHREPIVISGRVVRANGLTAEPISGATITLTGIWRTLPHAHEALPPAASPNIISLRPPLYLDRTAAVSQIRRREMAPILHEDKHLLTPAPRGSVRLELSDRVNLNSGDVIAIDPLDPDRLEHLAVDAIDGSSTPEQSTTVTLAHGTAWAHRRGAIARRVTPQAPGRNNSLQHDAIAGDTCAFLSSMDDLVGASTIEVLGGGGPSEYHSMHLFSAVSSATGYYRLPPLSRVAQIQLEVIHGALSLIPPSSYRPDYTIGTNRLDFVFR